MTQTHRLVRERQAMLAGMTPVLTEGTYIFCSTSDAAAAAILAPRSLALFREAEGLALVLPLAEAAAHGFDVSLPMRRIVLEVFSALDGVGLTAGVATALADAGIPCNMIAAYHHDNVFVPEPQALQALALLQVVQREAAAGMP
jgi:uncharacterized protein